MQIKKYFKDGGRTHGNYAMHYFFCEVLALINIFGQMYLVDRFLGYQFSTYGFDVLTVTAGNPAGRITTHDGLCILALNIINEKIYVFLWFWFVGAALFSIAAILYRIIILASHSIRVRVIMKKVHSRVNKKLVE